MGERKQKWIYENEELVEQVIQLVKRVRPFFLTKGCLPISGRKEWPIL